MILGGSRTARYLAEKLLGIGCNVKIIEQDEKIATELCEALPGAVIINGDGARQEVLLEEGLCSLDAFVALTGMDEENILTSIFASSQNVPKVIAKVNRDELAVMAEKLGLDTTVSPKSAVADVLVRHARAIKNSLGSTVETLYKLMDGDAEALEFIAKNDVRLVNIPLKDLALKSGTLIAGIIRDRKTIIPGGMDMIHSGDHVVVVTAEQHFSDLADILR
jgi:trk system potassium uptake protein TrkA